MAETNLSKHFLLRDDVTFLNFGSFGACPGPVFERYQQFQRELEQEPVQFLIYNGPEYLKKARFALGKYLNCHGDDVVCVTNPSYAVNIVAKSLNLKPGDQVLTTDLEYGACDRTWKYYCKQKGAEYIRQHINFPLQSKEDFIAQFMSGVTDRTKLIFISHITSSTALRLPVEEICKLASERGIMTFVDGAHGPGQIPVDLQELNADIYTGAAHKWMLCPKGSSFLFVKRAMQHLFDPLLISWGYEAAQPSHSLFIDYHELQGTRDTSAFCSIPAAIDFMEENNWVEVARSCRDMAIKYARELNEVCGSKPIAPIDIDFAAQMYAAELTPAKAEGLHDKLWNKYKIQIPVMPHDGKFFIRYSINGFNKEDDLRKLLDALKEELN